MDLDALNTPALLLDRETLQRNTAAMAARATSLGVALRPHLKTAKSATIARMATAGHSGGITVSTLREAEYFFEHGIRDVLYAVSITPQKLGAVAALRARGARVQILTDDEAVARAIADHDAAHDVLVEIDTGDHRTGLDADDPKLLKVAQVLAGGPRVTLQGVLTHAGHSYECRGEAAIAAVAEDERAGAVHAAERLREAGLPCPTVSVGSTPTATFVRDLTGVTEMRPGVYMFGDLYQAGIGVCTASDIAISVLASVIAHRPGDGRLIIDAGGLALSKDRSTAALADGDAGYGLVCDATGELLEGFRVEGVNQEHGFVTVPDSAAFARFPIGARVRVLPNHACMTAAAYDRYVVLEKGAPTETWDRCNAW